MEISWDGYKIENSGKKYQFLVGFYYGDIWNPKNDYSYQDLPSLTDLDMFANNNEVRTDYICVYDDGVLVGGIEPDGSAPVQEEKTTEKNSVAEPAQEDSQPAAAAEETAGKLGDVNEDGEIDILDVIALNKNLLGKEILTKSQQNNADVNQSGIPDADDSLTILKYIVGLIAKFK